MRYIKWVFWLAISVVIFFVGYSFARLNNAPVSLDMLVFQFGEQPLSLWLILFFIVGALAGLLASSLLILKEKGARLRVEKRLKTTSKLITG